MQHTGIISETIAKLNQAAKEHRRILVTYSGGKDSKSVLDLCCKAFKEVVCVHMYLVPGLKMVDDDLRYVKEKYGVEMMMFPNGLLARYLQIGMFCDSRDEFGDLKEFSANDVFAIAAEQAGCKLVAHGGKAKDGLWRKWETAKYNNYNFEHFYPLYSWTKYDVLAYLAAQEIPVPELSVTKQAGGVDLHPDFLLWLWDSGNVEDWETMREYFPYIESLLWRREWYNIPAKTPRSRAPQPIRTIFGRQEQLARVERLEQEKGDGQIPDEDRRPKRSRQRKPV